jgi:TonB-dependent receptor
LKFFVYYFFLAIIILFYSNFSQAQGKLTGVIKDSSSNSKLVGANVFIMGTSLGASTTINGQYLITDIPVGPQKIKISYIGYTPKIIDVEIVDNRILQLDVEISVQVLEGEEVVITGQASGQISAINQQVSSNTIINVVSEEKLKELPDANAAETIGHLPGVSILRSGGEANKIILRGLDSKFTSITINGVKVPATDETSRGVDLSMFSQTSLAGIELFKALTPDKDGDAIAGSVNLVTKKAPEVRVIRSDFEGSYNNLMESAKQYELSLFYGERFFDNVLGLQFAGALENRIRSNERVSVNYSFNQGFAGDYFINDFLLEFTDESRKRGGLSLLLDINTPDGGVIRINNVYGSTSRDYFLSTRDYPALGGGNQDGNPEYTYREREQNIETFNGSIRGDNYLWGLNLAWGLAFGQSSAEYPYDYEMIFVEPSGMNPVPAFRSNPEQLINYAINNFSAANLYWTNYRSQHNYDKERTAFMDIGQSFVISNFFSGEVKGGGKYRTKDRSNDRTEDFTPYYLGRWMNYERVPDGTFREKDFTGTPFEDWWRAGGGSISVDQFFNSYTDRSIFDSYLLNPLIDQDRLRAWWDLNRYGVNSSGSTQPNAQEVWANPLIQYDDYNITERVLAGYLMATLNFGQELTVLGGARVETEDNDYIASYMPTSVGGFPVTANTIRDTSSSASGTIWLPNLNISYRPADFVNIRAAVYKALSRPDFNMRLDRFIGGRPAEVGSQQLIYVGNPELKSAEAWNYELNTSFFGNEIGLISFSVYYKEINYMYHMLNNFNTAAERDANGVLQDSIMMFFGIDWKSQMATSAYNLTLPYNSPDPTKVWGFEFEQQINFHFLPGLLKNIVLSYNFSLINSETTVYMSRIVTTVDSSGPFPIYRSKNILVTKTEKLEGMPEFLGNVSLGYDIDGFSGRVSVFHKGEHNVSFSATGINDQITNAFTRVDLALRQKITDWLSLYLNVNNITNVEDGSSLTSRQYGYTLFDQSEQYGTTADLGITLQFE